MTTTNGEDKSGQIMIEQDPIARRIAVTKYGLPPCLHVPVAARCLASIVRFIGRIERDLSPQRKAGALLVRTPNREPRPEAHCDLGLPVWDSPAAMIFHQNPQVWVHVDYHGYRQAYIRAYPDVDISGLVVDHIENRQIARLKGWEYVRLCHITKGVNTSSGAGSEKMGVAYFSTDGGQAAERGEIRYGDVADLAKMLGFNLGGQAGGMDGLVAALPLFDPSPPSAAKICRCADQRDTPGDRGPPK